MTETTEECFTSPSVLSEVAPSPSVLSEVTPSPSVLTPVAEPGSTTLSEPESPPLSMYDFSEKRKDDDSLQVTTNTALLARVEFLEQEHYIETLPGNIVQETIPTRRYRS